MFRKEFFGLLLLVSLVSTLMLVGFVSSTGGPTVSVTPSTGVTLSADSYVRITGTGWIPNWTVTIYWDQRDADHIVALATPSGTGSFAVNQLEIEGMSVGQHTVIAVQGTKTATTTFKVSATTPPDDRILSGLQRLEDSTGGEWPLINGNNVIDVHQSSVQSDFELKALYVNFSYYGSPSLPLNVVWNNVTLVSADGSQFYPIDSTPYTGSNGTLEVLSKMKVERALALPGWHIDINLTITNAQFGINPPVGWEINVKAIYETQKDAPVRVDIITPF